MVTKKKNLTLWALSFCSAVLLSLPWLVPHMGIFALVGFVPLLCADYIKQLKAFPRAFLVRNDLLMPYNPDAPEPTAEQKEQFAIAEDLATGIQKSLLSKQLEMKD